jgi:hypothetical protein
LRSLHRPVGKGPAGRTALRNSRQSAALALAEQLQRPTPQAVSICDGPICSPTRSIYWAPGLD